MQPNAVVYVAAGREISRSADYLAEVVSKRMPIPYPALAAIVDAIRRASPGWTRRRRSSSCNRTAEILQAVYELIAQRCHENWVSGPSGSSCRRSVKAAGRKRRRRPFAWPLKQAFR
jgi:hypothetical protein